MADNVESDPGSGGATFATDDISGVQYPRNKIVIGADGTNDGDVSATNPIPADVISALPAGTNAIGKLAANSGVDIGDVDVTNLVPGTAATDLGKAEDAVHSSGDTGVMTLGVRQDALAAAAADGDYAALLLDDMGRLKTIQQAQLSTANSSTTPLGIGATFTGSSEDISAYAAVVINVFSDEDSAADGLSIEFSQDGTNWDQIETHTVSASTAFFLQAMGEAQFFRLRYTNGGTGQGAFRLAVFYRPVPSVGEVQPLDITVSDASDAQLVRSVLTGKQPGGGYTNIQATNGGNLKVSVEEALAFKVDDEAFTLTTDSVSMAGAIRDDTLGALAAVEGDAVPLRVGSTGALHTQTNSVIPGVGATNLGKAEDAVHSSGDVGVMSLAVRSDAATPVSADGDYHPLLVNDEGALWTHNAPNSVDSNNSTTSVLGSGATFTGTGTEVLHHEAFTVIINSSHDSATDGISFQYSSDDTNWDYVQPFTYTAADGGRLFQLSTSARYFRVVYTNGGTLQTHFRMQTILHHGTPLTTIHRLDDDVAPDRSATIQKSVTIAQQAGTGDFIAVQATAGGNFKISLEEVDGDIAGGGTEAAALRVTVANDSTGLLSVDDNGGSLTVDLPATTSGGSTPYRNVDVDETEDQIKGTAGQLYWLHAMNLTASVVYLQIYNATAASVTVGTTTPDHTFPIGTTGDTDGAGFNLPFSGGHEMDTAITIACTTTFDGSSGPATNGCFVNAGFK